MKSRFTFIIGCLWIIAGIFLASPVLIPALKGSNRISAAPQADNSQAIVNEEPLVSGTPSRIAFPSVNIDLAVAPGYYDAKSQSWTLSNDKAHFATITDLPNNKTGNTFIYGHNRHQVFTRLLDAKVGDRAVLTTDNGHTFTYVLRTIADIDPSNTSYLQTHRSPILTVQTCSGMWYENRRMFTFDLVEVS